MSLWSKFRKWYEPKFIATNNNYPFEMEELPSSPLAKFVRRVVKHWVGTITTVGVVFIVIAAIYTVRAFYAIPQTPQPQTIPAKPTTYPKEGISENEIIKSNNSKLTHNQTTSLRRKNSQIIETSQKETTASEKHSITNKQQRIERWRNEIQSFVKNGIFDREQFLTSKTYYEIAPYLSESMKKDLTKDLTNPMYAAEQFSKKSVSHRIILSFPAELERIATEYR